MIIKDHITIHHSLSDDGPLLNVPAIRKYHKDKGWVDIGYHFLIDGYKGNFEIISGRMLDESGAHCTQEGMNQRSIGICMVGNFDAVEPPQEQWWTCIKLVRSLMNVLDIPKENVDPHRKYATYKSCPGNKFDFDKFKAQL